MNSYRCVQLSLQPTTGQQQRLLSLLDAQRQLYNAALEERIGAWKWERRSVTKNEQFKFLTGWDHSVLEYGVTAARGTLQRIDRAFQNFFRRVKQGQTPGFPRFRSINRWDSVEYGQAASWKITASGRSGRIYVQNIGNVYFRTSKRGIRGTPKTLVLRKEGRRWRAYVMCAVELPEPLPRTNKQIGIDLGITHLLATSDGDLVENPRWTRTTAERLAQAQQQLARKKRGSGRRKKAVQKVAALNRKTRRQRSNEHHQISRLLVNSYDVIVHEDLKILNMTKRPAPRPLEDGTFAPNRAAAKAGLNREILSAGWGNLLRMITYKAEEAGRTVIAVDPQYTSQTCYRCGHVDAGNRTGTVFKCLKCGLSDHADINAARNVLRAGLARRLAA